MDDKKMIIEDDVIDARSSIDLICSTIDKTKYNFSHLCSPLITFGVISLFFFVLKLLNCFFERSEIDKIVSLAFPAVSLVLLAFYIRRFKLMKDRQGDYTLRIYTLWGYALFLPSIISIFRVFFFHKPRVSACFDAYITVLSLSFILVSTFITGILVKKKLLILFGVLSPVVALVCFFTSIALVEFKVDAVIYYVRFLNLQALFFTIVSTAVYVVVCAVYKTRRCCSDKSN